MSNRSRTIRILTISLSLIAGVVILAVKFYAAEVSDSSALRSDALESTVNVLAALFGLGAILFSEKPADKDHPYGHGKIEYFASAFEGGLITLAGFLILLDTVHRWLDNTLLDDLGEGLIWNLGAGAMNGILGAIILYTGKKHRSETLIADGTHLLTDLMTTVVLGAGLGLVLFTGWVWIDPLLALAASGFLFYTGFKLVRRSAHALLDGQNVPLIRYIINHLNQRSRVNIIAIHDLKAQEFGRDKHVDIHMVIPEFLTIKEAHDQSEEFVKGLREEFSPDSLIHIHLDPCEREFCKECPIQSCSVRRAEFVQQKPFTFESAVRQGKV